MNHAAATQFGVRATLEVAGQSVGISFEDSPVVQFKAFQYAGQTFELGHLRPYTAIFERPAKAGKPAESYSVNISFSHHCFTKGLPEDGSSYDPDLRCDIDGDERIFDARRWKLSKQLPSIIAGLPIHKCQQTGHGNFFTVALVDEDGTMVEYDVFFRAWKPGRGRLFMHVESAYVRENPATRPKGTTIAFFVILFNTRNGRPIHTKPVAH